MAGFQEKGTKERFAVSAQVDCALASPVLEDFASVRVKDISTSGTGLIVTEPVAPGMLLVIKLVNPGKKFAKVMFVRVVHITPLANGSYVVGGTLDTPLTYEELCALVM